MLMCNKQTDEGTKIIHLKEISVSGNQEKMGQYVFS